MTVQFLFPEGKRQALTFSYDDAQIHDRRLVDIFNQTGMKATFHLNSATLGQPGYITREEVKSLYEGHEVACHGVTHPYFNQLSVTQTMREVYEDRRELERCSGGIVQGMSYPFGEYNEELIRTAKDAGIVYSRTVEGTMNFNLPSDFMRWHPTCHHGGVTEALLDEFLNPPMYRSLSLLYIWGHSYEFAQDDSWSHINDICSRLQGREDVWYATNMEIYAYVTAMRSLVISVEGDILYNPSAVTLYVRAGGQTLALGAGERKKLDAAL